MTLNSSGARTSRCNMEARSPCLPATLFLAIHSFLPETLTKKVTVNPQKRLLIPPSFFSMQQVRWNACMPEGCFTGVNCILLIAHVLIICS
jgi:hypothetical protein